VTLERSTFAPIPDRFEAGTPAIAQAIGLEPALHFIRSLPMAAHDHVAHLATHLRRELVKRGALLYGSESHAKIGIVSFVLPGVHPHDLASVCDQHSVAVRAGHHCTMPLHQKLGVAATTRVSIQLYNTESEIKTLLDATDEALKLFK
jgi:cysteine desulfurase/selenocysteine lyase